MSYEGPKSQPKPIAITRLGQHIPDYYNSILAASMHTGIRRNTLNEALHTGKRIKRGNGEGCKVEYRNPEDNQTLQQKHDDFKSKKELAAFY